MRRHHMLRVTPQAWPAVLAAVPDHASLPLLRDWADRGWPLIARRAACGDATGHLPVGLPLPPALGKLRIALSVPPEALLSQEPPPLLRDAASVAPAAWHATIAALVEEDADTRCFGSLAWQYLTGLDYLSPTSDLDLLWEADDAFAADAKAARIAAIEIHAPMRLDGELVQAGGNAVQWREWLSDAREVLVKSTQGSRLTARNTVLP